MNKNKLISFLQNKKAFRITAVVYALLCVAGIVLLTCVDLSIRNSLCLTILGFIYISVYLICYFRGHCERGILAGTVRPLHLLLSVILATGIFLACGLNLNEIRPEQIRNRQLRAADAVVFTVPEQPEGETKTVIIRGIVYSGQDFNLYEIPLAEPWTFTDEGFITCSGASSEPLRIQLAPALIDAVYARTCPDGGVLRLRAGELSGEWSLASETEGEIALDFSLLSSAALEAKPGWFFQALLWLIAVSILTWLLMPLTVHVEQLISRSRRSAAKPAEPRKS